MTVTSLFDPLIAESRIPSMAEIMGDEGESTETIRCESRSKAYAFNQHDVNTLDQISVTIESPLFCQTSESGKPRPTVPRRIANVIFAVLLDETRSVVPIFMRYFAIHECVVILCGALYWLQSDIGALCISIAPGLVIIALLSHFLLTQFDVEKVRSTFHSIRHYLVAFAVFISGAFSIYLIYHTNTYLSSLLPKRTVKDPHSIHLWISNILQFPQKHSMIKVDGQNEDKPRPFDYRLCFVGSIIAPIIEETFKFGLLCLTFPVPFLWRFYKDQIAIASRKVAGKSPGKYNKNKLKRNSQNMASQNMMFQDMTSQDMASSSHSPVSTHLAHSIHSEYCIESLFIMFIAMCGGCGIAVMENIGYLAACQWQSTNAYCLPNKNQDILGAGLARGIFSVPFHCVTAGIMADVLCSWIYSKRITFFEQSPIHLVLKMVLSYPVAIALPTLLHSNFNYWMKGWPFMTGLITLTGYSILVSRIGHRYWIINNTKCQKEKTKTSPESRKKDMSLN